MAKKRPWGQLHQVKNRDWTTSYELYSQTPDFYMGYYYIHKHKENIGRMELHTPETDSSLANLFNSYKYGKDAFLSDTVTNQYKNLMDASMDRSVMSLVDSVFNKENSVEHILDKIHADLQKGFEDQFSPNKIIQMLNIEKSTNWSTSHKKNSNAKDVQALAEVLTGNMKNAKRGFAFLDEVLTGMAEAVRLLNSEEGDALASILSNTVNRKRYDVSIIGRDLMQQLNAFAQTHNGDTVNSSNALKAAALLKVVASRLETGTTRKGSLTIESLQGLVQKQFYSMLAEIFITNIGEAAENAAVKYIVKAVSDINNEAGTDEVPIEATDPEGNFYKPSPQYLNDGEKKFGKADAKFNNVQVSLQSYIGDENGYFTMSVGISNKAYITNYIGEGSLKKFSVYSLGGGMTIGNALNLLLGGSGKIREKYLAYNIFGQGDALPQALQSLQDILLTRSIIYLAGARGKTDFAQFMLLNGELLSVWDIVKFALGNNIGISSSQQTKGQNNGIYLSIPNRLTFMKYAQSRFWARRVVKTNISITNAVMKAHIVPKQIIEYASNNIKT